MEIQWFGRDYPKLWIKGEQEREQAMTLEDGNFLDLSWCRAWKGLGVEGDGGALKDALIRAYREPQRRYHNLQHLVECLQWLAQYRHLAHHPVEVEMALWFHDAVYEVKRHDNELKSAQWAENALSTSGVRLERIKRIRDLIMMTQHQEVPVDQDAQLMVDIDLAILGAELERFAEYELQIRVEYHWVTEQVYCEKRAEVLLRFMERSPLYQTEELRVILEDRAHRNLSQAVQALQKRIQVLK